MWIPLTWDEGAVKVGSVLNKPFLLGPGMQWFQRAGTRVPAPMGDNR